MQEASGGEIIYARPVSLPGTELLLAIQDSNYWHAFHERYAVCACSKAACDWTYRGKRHFVSDRSHMLLEPGETPVNRVVHKPADHNVLFMDAAIVEGSARELGLSGTPHFRVAHVTDQVLFAALQRFYDAVAKNETVLEQQSWFTACLRLLLEHHAERTPPAHGVVNGHRAIERAKEYLRERFNESVGLDELSKVAGLSRFHLLRTFSRHVGLPPHAYQIHIRVERARDLLRAGVPPSSVASLIGFADQSHFTRHFKRVFRTTPGKYALG